jgi:hypothetical protein
MGFVTPFFQRAEEILDVASAERSSQDQETAILIDRRGGIRMLDSTGWSLPGLLAEFGAAVVYRVRKSGAAVKVEGWDGMQKCEIQRGAAVGLGSGLAHPGALLAMAPQPRMLQAMAPLTA